MIVHPRATEQISVGFGMSVNLAISSKCGKPSGKWSRFWSGPLEEIKAGQEEKTFVCVEKASEFPLSAS
jgi:hypothetical protein